MPDCNSLSDFLCAITLMFVLNVRGPDARDELFKKNDSLARVRRRDVLCCVRQCRGRAGQGRAGVIQPIVIVPGPGHSTHCYAVRPRLSDVVMAPQRQIQVESKC